MQNKKWLPHLTNEMMIGARNSNLCSYLIALEGWRRGLTLKFYSDLVTRRGVHAPGRLFSLSSKDHTYFFYKAKGDHVSRQAVGITNNKDMTKDILKKHGIPIPTGKRFLGDIGNDEIIQYARDLGYPVVLKPNNGAQGVGVVANIKNEDHFKEALLNVRTNFPDVIVERYITGEEFRVFVLEDNAIAVMKRIPANIIGDGRNSIKMLIEKKNLEKRRNPRSFSSLIKIDHEVRSTLKKRGYSLESIPQKGVQVFLRENTNVSTGGDSIDATDELPVEIKNIAVKSLQAIPDLAHAGVDIIVNPDLPIEKSGFVIEINAVPQIGAQVFPAYGKSRDIPSALIDYYFPETKDKNDFNPRVYFDFKTILQSLRNRSASEVTVIPAPSIPFYAKKYVVKGTVQDVRYRRWIRKKALEADLYGYVQNLNDGTVAVVVAGAEAAVKNFKKECMEGSRASKVTEVSESVWSKSIKVGFEIRANPKVKKKKKIQQPKRPKKLTLIQKVKRLLKRIIKRFIRF